MKSSTSDRQENDSNKESCLSNALLDIVPGIALVLKKYDREIVFCNESAKQMGAVVGKICFETICKSDTACPFCKAPDLWESGEKQHVEAEYLGKFWEAVWLPYNDDLYLHYIFDITDRKWAEQELRESKEIVEKYLNVANEIIIALDTHGNITFMNDSGYRLLGYDAGELTGKNWFHTCLPEEERKEVLEVFGQLTNEDMANPATYENRVVDKHGTEFSILWHNTPIKDAAGRTIGSLSSGENITERKNIELELEKHRTNLESLVSKRTTELQLTNKKLGDEIIERMQVESELQETNNALKVLLKQRKSDKIEFEERITSNIKLLLMPYLEKAKKASGKHAIAIHLNILESNLKELVSSFSLKLSSPNVGLTPKEIAVADMVRNGYQDKEIAETLNLSIYTIKVHRKNIRKKLGITGKNVNLTSFLSSITK